jgi:hypothetical protein
LIALREKGEIKKQLTNLSKRVIRYLALKDRFWEMVCVMVGAPVPASQIKKIHISLWSRVAYFILKNKMKKLKKGRQNGMENG